MITRITAALRDLLFPTKCRACGILFRPPEMEASRSGDKVDFKDAMSPFLCPECRGGFLPVSSPICPVCGEVFVSREGKDHLCSSCIESPRKFRKARAVGVYENGLLKAVHCLKYRDRIELARPLGDLLLAGFLRYWSPDDIDLVIPVPLHGIRMRKRGFNQSLLLIGSWPKRMASNGNGMGEIRIAPELLARSKPTAPQTGLGRRERMKNLRGAFTVPAPERINGRRILLVDDVYTTGTTAGACARALRKAGAARVDVLTLARTMGR
jgi:ComF family protein